MSVPSGQQLPGQLWVLQLSMREGGPEQESPPLAGGGLEQVRARARLPPSQEREQAVQLSQALHPPDTGHPTVAQFWRKIS